MTGRGLIVLFFFLSFDTPHYSGAHSEGVDVPVCSEGDGDGGEDAECFECHFKKFHFIGGLFFDCWPSALINNYCCCFYYLLRRKLIIFYFVYLSVARRTAPSMQALKAAAAKKIGLQVITQAAKETTPAAINPQTNFIVLFFIVIMAAF